MSDDTAVANLAKLEQGKILESDLRNYYAEKARAIDPILRHYLDSIFAPLHYQVGVMKEFVEIRSNRTNRRLVHQPILIYSSGSAVSRRYGLSSGKWQTSHTTTTTNDKSDLTEVERQRYSFLVERKSYFEIENLEWVVYKDLASLMIASILILAAVLALFYLTYKNLLRQRKEVCVLHDMMDNIAHELRTPIATLRIAAKNMEKTKDSPIVRVIERQISRLENIVEPMGTIHTTPDSRLLTEEDLNSFLADFELTNSGIVIKVECPNIQHVTIHQYDIEVILNNLLNNSVKYGAKEIWIAFYVQKDHLKITVKDNGIGIESKEQPYIFEKYYRIQKDNVQETKGLGLGLYIVRHVAKKYKGQVSVSSEWKKGAIFHVTLYYEC